MTLLQMTMPQVESRLPTSSERPTTVKSAEESSARFFEQALQRAEARKSSVEREEHRSEANRNRAEAEESERESCQARESRPAEESRPEARTESESAKSSTREASKETDQSTPTTAETDIPSTVSDETAEQAALPGEPGSAENPPPASNKSRASRKKGNAEEIPWMALSHGLPLVARDVSGATVTGEGVPEGVMPTGSANISSPGQPGMGQPLQGGQPPGVAMPGQAEPGTFTLPPSPAQRLAETMGTRTTGRAEVALPQTMNASEEKNDFAFAMRLVSDGSRAAGSKPGVTTQTPLSAHSPTFGEDLAGEVGRLRVIARPGESEQVRIALHPRDLGGLDMRLMVDEEKVVHLMITAESETTKELLNRQLPQLREALARQNLELGEVTVQVDDGRGGENAPEWGFQGGAATGDEERSGLIWRGGRGGGGERAESSVEPSRPVPTLGGGSGLSLFA
ncbi:MAG: flagellar hook-length control protein FliK [Magnetococcales bacterium]|nr:flagellar hook-length control protein FliK [Magnetococcales bacterium]